jgi:hypothetical protein
MVDAIRLELGEGPGRRRWLVEFYRNSTPRILEDTGEGLEAVATEDLDRPFIDWQMAPNGWRAQVRIPRNAWPTPSAEGVPLQIGIADNDDTYHTQWRWLAPPDHPVRVVLPGENAPDSR